ncbi:MAG: preQ(1) synthase [Solidesulfovibrio sp.]|uniref:preQ(1) synthase n=1 Tax=Solidesulfovibrio sp. TaxID=2910990 RepID=UPI002B1F71ED|nr:preQ(1) synthase [Solidesulfovibrio sp.]MEA4856846.1 preQ(1) synthase [Solidesulfovibrio sp.]
MSETHFHRPHPDDVSGLKTLGQGATAYPRTVTPELLETFPNAYPDRRYTVTFASQEFTSLCPKTGQPDFGTITIRYVPGERCIESKSLKLYLFSYRDEGTFMETLTNRILDDLVDACAPLSMEVTGDFAARGGITISVAATYVKP